jgi:hypothetical protein
MSDDEDKQNEATFWSEAGDGCGCMLVLIGLAVLVFAAGAAILSATGSDCEVAMIDRFHAWMIRLCSSWFYGGW